MLIVEKQQEQVLGCSLYLSSIFSCTAENEFIFTYRDGQSGNGNQIYDLKNKTWRRFLDKPLTDGEGKHNAYFNGPILGPDGYFSLAWIWWNY